MAVSNAQKFVDRQTLGCDETMHLTLCFDAAPELIQRPADMILVMDRSGSMAGSRIQFARQAAKSLIRTVARASGDATGLTLANGSRIGLASFSVDAVEDVPLTTDVSRLYRALDSLQPGGNTNHYRAFTAAQHMLDAPSGKEQVVILFTDGETTEGPSADPLADAMRRDGIEIYCIGLTDQPEALRTWASTPTDTHVATTQSPAALQVLFEQIAAQVVHAGAQDVVIRESLHPDFRIVQMDAPTHGVVEQISPQTVQWTLGAVGVTGPETAALTFVVQYVGHGAGRRPVNAEITYTDRAGSQLTFPQPEVEILCPDKPVQPEPCPEPVPFWAAHCRDAVEVQVPEVQLTGLGRIVQVSATIRSVCPGKRVAVAVLLSEQDAAGTVYPRGMKTVLLPAQTGTECRDVTLRCVRFVVPEQLAPAGGGSLCQKRQFRVQVLANYVDTDFVCCDAGDVTL